MSTYQAKPSKDGHVYTKRDGLVGGLNTYAVIQPDRKVRSADKGHVWDVIIIGAGYAGLVAARDLVKVGE